MEIKDEDMMGESDRILAAPGRAASSGTSAARRLKVAILGAGSAEFARRLMTDLLCTPGLEAGVFALVDIDPGRLELAQGIGEELVDATGLHPVRFESLPPQLAALDAAHMHVHELMVQAVLEQDKAAALQALMLDPLTAAVGSLDEIRQMFEAMWEAERADLAAFEG